MALGLHLVLVITLQTRAVYKWARQMELVPLKTSLLVWVLNNEGNDSPMKFIHLTSPVVVRAMYSVGRRRRQQMATNATAKQNHSDGRVRASASHGSLSTEQAGRKSPGGCDCEARAMASERSIGDGGDGSSDAQLGPAGRPSLPASDQSSPPAFGSANAVTCVARCTDRVRRSGLIARGLVSNNKS